MDGLISNHRRGKRLKRSEREIVRNVFFTLKNGNPGVTINDIAKIAAHSTGVSTASVYNILKEFKQKGKNISPKKTRERQTALEKLEEFDKNAIRRKVHSFYFKNELPTMEKVLKAVNEDKSLPDFSRTTFQRVLKNLDFRFTTIQRKPVLTEKQDIILWRCEYLRNIKKFRSENKKIYYLGETLLDAGSSKESLSVDLTGKNVNNDASLRGKSSVGVKRPHGKEKRLAIAHIGSETGFLPDGLWMSEAGSTREYQEEMNSGAFTEWFRKILEKVEENSVFVMDNASYRCIKTEKFPNATYSNREIMDWFRNKNIAVEKDLLKIELIKRVNEIKRKCKTYKIDEMAKQRNCEALRIPPYHSNLNPIELVWSRLKSSVVSNDTYFNLDELKIFAQKEIETITERKWKEYIEQVIEKEENFMREADYLRESIMENLITNFSADSDSSEETVSASSDLEEFYARSTTENPDGNITGDLNKSEGDDENSILPMEVNLDDETEEPRDAQFNDTELEAEDPLNIDNTPTSTTVIETAPTPKIITTATVVNDEQKITGQNIHVRQNLTENPAPLPVVPVNPVRKRMQLKRPLPVSDILDGYNAKVSIEDEYKNYIDEDKAFLMSLLPAMKELTGPQKMEFKMTVLNELKRIRYPNSTPTPQTVGNLTVLPYAFQPIPNLANISHVIPIQQRTINPTSLQQVINKNGSTTQQTCKILTSQPPPLAAIIPQTISATSAETAKQKQNSPTVTSTATPATTVTAKPTPAEPPAKRASASKDNNSRPRSSATETSKTSPRKTPARRKPRKQAPAKETQNTIEERQIITSDLSTPQDQEETKDDEELRTEIDLDEIKIEHIKVEPYDDEDTEDAMENC